eukprot:3613130-Prymnesium_polylepis.1
MTSTCPDCASSLPLERTQRLSRGGPCCGGGRPPSATTPPNTRGESRAPIQLEIESQSCSVHSCDRLPPAAFHAARLRAVRLSGLVDLPDEQIYARVEHQVLQMPLVTLEPHEQPAKRHVDLRRVGRVGRAGAHRGRASAAWRARTRGVAARAGGGRAT